MHQFVTATLVVVAALLVFTILSQSRGTGLSATFGGEGTTYHTKRGPEKVLFVATIILSILFFALALALPFIG